MPIYRQLVIFPGEFLPRVSVAAVEPAVVPVELFPSGVVAVAGVVVAM
jgi:hypothetical protein